MEGGQNALNILSPHAMACQVKDYIWLNSSVQILYTTNFAHIALPPMQASVTTCGQISSDSMHFCPSHAEMAAQM